MPGSNSPLDFPYAGLLHTPGVVTEKPEDRWTWWEKKAYEDEKDPLYHVKPTWEWEYKTYLEPESHWQMSPYVHVLWAAFKPVFTLAGDLGIGATEQERRLASYEFAKNAAARYDRNRGGIAGKRRSELQGPEMAVVQAALKAAQEAWE